MSTEVALWIAGTATAPAIGFFVFIYLSIVRNDRDHRDAAKENERKHQEIMEILRNPEDHGLGTTHTNKAIENSTRAMNALVHYIKWLAAKSPGGDPPPPLE